MICAVIDLGSNTFHLLITESGFSDPLSFNILHRETHFTGLSAGGGNRIPEDIYEEALKKIKLFADALTTFRPDKVKIVGTAVLRTATNSLAFVHDAEKILGYPIDIIEGLTEAMYIAHGSLIHEEIKKGNHVILDIGGGSTECIYICEGQIKAVKSFPLGVGVLKTIYFKNDPISQSDLAAVNRYFEETAAEWLSTIYGIEVDSIAGASGTFESLENIICGKSEYGSHVTPITLESFENLYHTILSLCEQDRKLYPGVPEKRAVLLPVGMELIRFFIQKLKPKKLLTTHYSMKEGIALSLVN
jgi:exopolyphosphatase/guanosine-5'-triphosphate,3'-diphosphate pyrophosphatase